MLSRRDLLAAAGTALRAQPPGPDRPQAIEAMLRATRYFRTVATEGGYLWRYSLDLRTRHGETPATATQIWVQPPGTPTVGMAMLAAHRATGEREFGDGALAAARALERGQLQSGGWDYVIEFNPELRWKWDYRGSRNGQKNISTLDDDNTQSALRFLMEMESTAPEAARRAAIDYGLQALLDNQFASGAWPQRFPAPPDGYMGLATFNDNTIADTIETLLLAHRLYKQPRYLGAVRKAGDFMLSARLPEPQPIWAQQYDRDLKPVWARKFEPPSVSSSESAGVLRILIRIHAATGDDRYLAPIEPAIAYFRRSSISPGRWARFYELGTNKPLYFTRKYELTYDGSDNPTHYSFQGPMGVEDTIAAWERYKRKEPEPKPRPTPAQVREAITSLDSQGRWITRGEIQCRTFVQNLGMLTGAVSIA